MGSTGGATMSSREKEHNARFTAECISRFLWSCNLQALHVLLVVPQQLKNKLQENLERNQLQVSNALNLFLMVLTILDLF